MAKQQGKTLWEDIKESGKKPFQPRKKERNKPETLKEWREDEVSTKDKLRELEDKLEQMRSGLEGKVRDTQEQMKEIKDILMATTEKNMEEEKDRDKIEEMKSEILGNISKKLETLTTGMLDNIREKFEQMKTEMESMREKLDTLRAVAEEDKDEGQQPVLGGWNPVDHDHLGHIRQLYTIREGWLAPFPWCEEFHFHLNDIFTRLKMVSREKTRGKATSDIVGMSAIFQPHKECSKPRTVLIEGKPGMGKTTYCNKLAYDWATKQGDAGDYFPNFEVVLLLKCRDVDADLWEAIDDQLLPRDFPQEERNKFFEFIRRNQSSVLLILDGLDELPTSKMTEFSEIIQGRMLPKCHFVVTARHEAGITMRKFCDTLLEIEGFTKKDAKKFIRKYFKTVEDLAQKLLSKVEGDSNLKEMVSNPLNTALLCLLCEDFQGKFPESRTQLYLEMVKCVLIRYRKKKELPVDSKLDVIEVYKVQLKHLGSIALEGLLIDDMYFEDKQLGDHTGDLPEFGFLSVQPGSSKRRPCRCYGFLHKSFQEFFAGFFLCCQLVSREISPETLVADTRYFLELKQVLLFTCGMLATKCEETAVALIKSLKIEVNKAEYSQDFVLALECIKECKQEQSDLHVRVARTFGSCLRLQKLRVYDKIGDTGAAVLADLVERNTSLKELDLTNNNLGAPGAAALANALTINKTLTKLDLTGSNIGVSGAVALADTLKINRTLTELHLSRCNFGASGAAALAAAIKVNTTLTRLYLSSNDLSAAGTAAKLIDALSTNITLRSLFLTDKDINPSVVKEIKEAHGLRVIPW